MRAVLRAAVAASFLSAALVAALGASGAARADVVGVALTGAWALLAGLGVLLAPHRLVPLPRRWRLGGFLLGAPYGVGQLVLAAERATSAEPLPFPSTGDLISFVAAPGWFVVLLLVPRPAVPAGRLPRVLADAGVVAAAVALLFWRVAFTDVQPEVREDVATVAASVATQLLELLILALVVQLAVVGRQRAVVLLAVAVGLIVCGDLAFSAAVLHGTTQPLWEQQVLLAGAWPLVAGALLGVRPPRQRPDVVVEATSSTHTTTALALCAAGAAAEVGLRGRGLDAVTAVLALVLIVAWTARELVLQRQRVAQVAALRAAADLDPLTGLANRRALAAALAELGAGSGQVGVVVIDLDGFKRVNDTLGHSTGDALVVAVAAAMRRVREDAVAARLGGDEFALVVPAPAAEVTASAHRLAELVRESAREVPGVARVRVSASVGVTVVEAAELREAADALAVVARASAAMQEAKRRGRDRVVEHAEVAGAATRRRLVRAALEDALRTGEGLLVRRTPLVGADGAAAGHLLQLGLALPEGPAAPHELDDVARRDGLEGPLARHALQLALSRAAAGAAPDRGARSWVRLGAHLLHDDAWPSLVAAELAARGTPAGALVLLLEGRVRPDDAGVLAAARALAGAGVALAVSSRGQGAALEQLVLLPLSALLVDASAPPAVRAALEAAGGELGLELVSGERHAQQAVVPG
ncbi:diguanylate cyclase [Quadrisphaera sp. KR29]|uniref:diguanylate cyclase n=1 Tax=Quadrisphaera sp. KR29 TaxID=3461391 RepID=UPI004043DD18